jgi:hypothetical protein
VLPSRAGPAARDGTPNPHAPSRVPFSIAGHLTAPSSSAVKILVASEPARELCAGVSRLRVALDRGGLGLRLMVAAWNTEF